MEHTENIGLGKAAGSEYYSIALVNENLDKVDKALGTLNEAVGVGGTSNIADKIGENTDTEAGTVFGDLHIIRNQTEQNGTDIAEVKTVVDSNAEKLNALQTSANNTKSVVDLINTQTESVKQTGEQTAGKVDTLLSVVDTLSQTLASVHQNILVIREDTYNTATNVYTLLTRNSSVKQIYTTTVTGTVTSSSGAPVVINIPDSMNTDRIVVLTNVSHTLATNTQMGVNWRRNGRELNIYAISGATVNVQIVEFY